MKKIIFMIFVLVFGISSQNAGADQATLKNIETYFDTVKSLKGRFFQIFPNGSSLDGTFYLKRPGKMRFDYDKPSHVSVIADGTWLIHYDAKLEQASRALQDSTPADLLTRSKVRFNGDLQVVSVKKSKGVIRVRVRSPKFPDAQIVLVFQERPLSLKQWEVIESNGNKTTVALTEYQTNISINKDKFNFISPEWEKRKRDN